MKKAYKIVAPLLSIAVLPALFFLPLLHLSIGSALNANGGGGALGLPEYSSLFDMVKTAANTDSTTQTMLKMVLNIFTSEDNKIGAAVTTKGFFVAAVVFLALMLVLALLVFFFALFTKKYLLTAGFAAGGVLCAVLADKMFDVFAKPFLSGAVSLSNLLDDSSGLLGGLLGGLIRVEHMELAMAYQICIVLLAAAAVCAVAVVAQARFAED